MQRPHTTGVLVAFVVLASACSSSSDRTSAVTGGSALPAAGTAVATASAPAPAAAGAAAAAVMPDLPPPDPPAPDPPPPTPAERLRTDLARWKGTPYESSGTSHRGIGDAAFAQVLLREALDVQVPASHDEQMRTGKLVTRKELAPGDLVFFEGGGFGPFRSKSVGVYLGQGEFAAAIKDRGVTTARLSDAHWASEYKTARRVTEPHAAAPTFSVADYGRNREALLRDIADAWKGTLYKQGGTTFEGIGNDEFVREVYEGIYEAELPGTPKEWATMGKGVRRASLQPGDIILYEAVGLGSLLNRRHAGIYIGGGEFVHSVKGSAVTISRVDDPRWSKAYRAARRIDPDVLARQAEAREVRTAAAKAPATHAATAVSRSAGTTPSSAPHAESAGESRLRAAVQPWVGTPYRIGGTTKKGIDCSAFVREMFEEVYDQQLPRTAQEQEALGARLKRSDLETGDLVFFRTKGLGPFLKDRHVGIYLGDGEFAHASSSHGVMISRLDQYYWNRKYEGARRVHDPS